MITLDAKKTKVFKAYKQWVYAVYRVSSKAMHFIYYNEYFRFLYCLVYDTNTNMSIKCVRTHHLMPSPWAYSHIPSTCTRITINFDGIWKYNPISIISIMAFGDFHFFFCLSSRMMDSVLWSPVHWLTSLDKTELPNSIEIIVFILKIYEITISFGHSNRNILIYNPTRKVLDF